MPLFKQVCKDTIPDSSAIHQSTQIDTTFDSDNVVVNTDSTQQHNSFSTLFKPFKTFNKSTSIESTTSLTIQQQNVSYKTKADFTTQYMLNKQMENEYQFDVSVTKLKTSVETMGLQLQYNSQDSLQQDTTSNFAKTLFDMVGKNILLNVDSTGKIVSVDTSNVSNKISNVLSGLSVADEDFEIGNNFGLIMNKSIDSLQLRYTWTDSSNIQNKRRVTKYTVQSRLRNEIVLLVNGIVEQAGTLWSGNHVYNADLSGTQTGKIIISESTGLIKLRNINYTLQGAIHFNGQDIPATATSRINETIN